MAFRSGVADSIEQHMVKVNEPGGPFGLGNETERGRVCQPTVKRRLAKVGWSWDVGRDSEETG